MINHVWSLLCQHTLTDKDTNIVSIQCILEQVVIFASPIPGGVLPIHAELTSLWVRGKINDPESGQYRVTFSTPSDKTTIVAEPPIDLSKVERLRSRIIFEQLPIEEEGRHLFIVELKKNGEWLVVANIPLLILFSAHEEIKSTVEE